MQKKKSTIIIFIVIFVIITTIYLMIDSRLKKVQEIQMKVSSWIEKRDSYFGVPDKKTKMVTLILSDETQELTFETEEVAPKINSGIIGRLQILQYCSEITASQAAALKEIRRLVDEYGEDAYYKLLFSDSANVLLMDSSPQNIRGTILLHFLTIIVWLGLIFTITIGGKKHIVLKFVYIITSIISFFIINAKFWYVNDKILQILFEPLLLVGGYDFWRFVFCPCLTAGLSLAILIKIAFYDGIKFNGAVWIMAGYIVSLLISPVGVGILSVLENTIVLPQWAIDVYFDQSRIIAAAEIMRIIFLFIGVVIETHETKTQEPVGNGHVMAH